MKIFAALYYPASLIEALLNSVLPVTAHAYTPFASLLLNVILLTVFMVWITELVCKKRTSGRT